MPSLPIELIKITLKDYPVLEKVLQLFSIALWQSV